MGRRSSERIPRIRGRGKQIHLQEVERRSNSNLFKKGDKAGPGNYRGITLLSTVGQTFCKILNDRVGMMLEKGEEIIQGQAGFRPKRIAAWTT